MFTFSTAQKVILGIGSISQINEEVKRLGGHKVAIITDQGIVKAGLDKELTVHLKALEYDVWSNVESEPSVNCSQEAISYVKEERYSYFWPPDRVSGG